MNKTEALPMESLKKSFKSHGSFIHMVRKPGDEQEDKPILEVDGEDAKKFIDLRSERKEVVVKIDNGRDVELGVETDDKIWAESSYDYWEDIAGGKGKQQENAGGMLHSCQSHVKHDSSKHSGDFLNREHFGEMSLNVNLENDKPQPEDRHISPVNENLKHQNQHRVSFNGSRPPLDFVKRHYKNFSDDDDEDDDSKNQNGASPKSEEVMKCPTNSSFRRNFDRLQSRNKSRSRLLDPPGDEKKSGMMRSGLIKSSRLGMDEDEDDPFSDDDLPDEYKKSNVSMVTILQLVVLIVIVVIFVCTFKISYLKQKSLWNLHLWKWELLVLALICGHLVSGWAIRIIVVIIERNFLLRKRVLYFVYALRKAVQNCLWLGLVLIAWFCMFDKDVERETNNMILPYVTKILLCLLVTSFIWLIKTLLVKVLATSFHVSTYFDRIQDALFHQYVIETLSGPPLVEIQNVREEEEQMMNEMQQLQNAGAKIPADLRAAALPSKSFRVIRNSGIQKCPQLGKSFKLSRNISRHLDEGITIDHLHKLNQKNISAWNMKRLMKIIRHSVLSTLDEQIQDATNEDESMTQIQSEHEAKLAAKKIFTNVAKPKSKYIYLVDLMRFMRKDEAMKTMGLFEGAKESQRVNKTALKNWAVDAFRERRALSLSLNDTKTAVNKLHQMINVVVGIIVFIICLLILEIATTHILVLVSSQVVLVAFIFGNTCKMIFEAIIFLFVMHPFDVGDRCEIEGVQMIVEEMNILTTVFLRADNLKIIYPNSVLATHPINNFYRSPDMGDAIDFCIHVSTLVEKIAKIKERIKGFIESKKEYWYADPMVVVRDVDDMNRLKISVWLQHRMNHQNMGERFTRRALVVEEIIRVLRELDVEYRMLPLDINVRQMPPLTSSRLPSNWLVGS